MSKATDKLVNDICTEISWKTEKLSDEEYIEVLEAIAENLKDSANVKREEMKEDQQ